MRGDPPNEYLLETTNRIWWFLVCVFFTVAVNFVTREYKNYQEVLNKRAKLMYDGRH